jgi:hypothetical protein
MLKANSGLHLLPIPFTKQFADYYTLGELTSKDYPHLIPDGQKVDTIAVPTVLAVYNWPKGSDRYRRVERFTERLFANWSKFQNPPFHPKWRDINLAARPPRCGAALRGDQRGRERANQGCALAPDLESMLRGGPAKSFFDSIGKEAERAQGDHISSRCPP